MDLGSARYADYIPDRPTPFRAIKKNYFKDFGFAKKEGFYNTCKGERVSCYPYDDSFDGVVSAQMINGGDGRINLDQCIAEGVSRGMQYIGWQPGSSYCRGFHSMAGRNTACERLGASLTGTYLTGISCPAPTPAVTPAVTPATTPTATPAPAPAVTPVPAVVATPTISGAGNWKVVLTEKNLLQEILEDIYIPAQILVLHGMKGEKAAIGKDSQVVKMEVNFLQYQITSIEVKIQVLHGHKEKQRAVGREYHVVQMEIQLLQHLVMRHI